MERRPRKILGWTLLVAAALTLAWTLARQSAVPEARDPLERGARSVVLVTVDTTRADRLEPYGAENVETPHLARLARRGVVFEHAYSVAPITLVAHTSILTGLDPSRHGVRNNGTHYVPDDIDTLAEILSDEGYRTGAFVSAAVLEKRYNLAQGFGVYDDDLSGGRERHERMVPDRPAEVTVRAAADWLDQLDDDDPYFLWVHLYDPHAAYSPPPPYRDTYRGRLYDGEIAYMDEWIGRLLRHPRVDSDTVVSVLGDHGESLGEHGEQTHALLAYDSTLHVPWILHVPGGPEGLRIDTNVGQVDWMPTLLDLLGVSPPKSSSKSLPGSLSGVSLLPLLEGTPHRLAERPLYAETWLPFFTYGWSKLRVWRQGRYKWINAPTPELFDTRRDPRELSNVTGQQPGLSHDLGRDLAEHLAAAGDDERQASLDLDSEAREKLRSLGYLSVGSGRDDGVSERPDPKELIDLHVGLERARFLLRDRLYEQAEEVLRGVLRRDGTNLAAMIDLATALSEQERLDEAVQVVERALDADPAYARLHLLLAGLEARRGDAAKALELYDAALAVDPRSVEANLQKALLLSRLRRVEAAESLLEQTLARHPDSPQVQTAYAQVVEMRRGDLEAAEARLRDALERDPFAVAAWRLLARIQERQGRRDEAVASLRSTLERSVDDAESHAQLGILLAGGGGAEAEAHLREALRLSRVERPEVRVALGAWLAERRRFDEALAQYDRVLAEHPNHADASNNRAVSLFQTGRAEEAKALLEDLVARQPNNADAHNNLAAIAFGLGDLSAMERHARRALSVRDDLPEAWNNLGLARGGQGDPTDARRCYENALAIEPAYWQARLNLGQLLARLGEARAAESTLEEVVRQVPQAADAHLALGDLHTGPLAEAEDAAAKGKVHYNAFLRQAPGHPRAAEIRRRLAGHDVAE